MSKPRYKWWGYVKNVIRAYPGLKAQLEELQRQSTIAAYGPVSGHSGTGRPAEQAAMKLLPSPEQREYEAVEAAIRETKQLPDGETRLKIIEMVFWRRSHTLQGAAMQVHMSYASAKRRHNDFICLVAEKLSLKSQNPMLK